MKNKKLLAIFTTIIIVLAIVLIIILLFGNGKKEEKDNSDKGKDTPTDVINKSILEFGNFNKLDSNSAKRVLIRRYTEGGMLEEEVTDPNEIIRLYNMVKSVTILEESNMSCEDNTTAYIFEQENETIVAEFECEWLVIGNKRYTIK